MTLAIAIAAKSSGYGPMKTASFLDQSCQKLGYGPMRTASFLDHFLKSSGYGPMKAASKHVFEKSIKAEPKTQLQLQWCML